MRSIAQGYGRPDLSSRSTHLALVRRFWRLQFALGIAMKVRRERRMLLGLDDRTLKDLGFDRCAAYREAQRSFWDVPIDRLRR